VIRERALVVTVDGDHAWLERRSGGGCGGCSAAGGCGTRLLGSALGRRPVRLRARNLLGAVPGDEVIVGLAEGALLAGALRAYGLPLATMLLGAGGVRLLGADGDLAGALGALGGLALGLAWVARGQGRGAADPRFEPTMLAFAAPAGERLPG